MFTQRYALSKISRAKGASPFETPRGGCRAVRAWRRCLIARTAGLQGGQGECERHEAGR